jgi:hypothetical protein
MKYLITESQFQLISELERTWRDSEYKEQYERIKDKLIPYFVNKVESYDDSDNRRITLFDSDNKLILVFYTGSGELFYNRELDELYYKLLPHPLWLVHGKFIMSDIFEQLFPDYKVLSARSVGFS